MQYPKPFNFYWSKGKNKILMLTSDWIQSNLMSENSLLGAQNQAFFIHSISSIRKIIINFEVDLQSTWTIERN